MRVCFCRGWEYFYFVDGWSTEFNFDGLKAWNADVHTFTRTLDPETLQKQLESYSKEALDNFWGSQMQLDPYKDEPMDYGEQVDEYGQWPT